MKSTTATMVWCLGYLIFAGLVQNVQADPECASRNPVQEGECLYKKQAQGENHPGDCPAEKNIRPKEMFFKKIFLIDENEEKLGISEDQYSALKKLRLETKKSLIMKEAEIEVNEVDLDGQLGDDTWEAQILNGLIDKKFDLKKEEAKIVLNAFVALKSTLTEEQQHMLRELCGDGKKAHKPCPLSMKKSPLAGEHNPAEQNEARPHADEEHSAAPSSAQSETKEDQTVPPADDSTGEEMNENNSILIHPEQTNQDEPNSPDEDDQRATSPETEMPGTRL